jgi:hypothetical protein
MLIEKLKRKDNFERDIILISISNIEEFDFKALPQLSRYFTLFIANNKEVITEKYSTKADELIKSGLVYLCTWGNDCERIHDIVDEEIVSLEIEQTRNVNDDNVIMTTWHNKESLKDALWFFLKNTMPTEKYYNECKSALVLIIGNSIEINNIKLYLENQDLLDQE